MVKIQNRIEHASQHLINAKSTLVIKTLSGRKKDTCEESWSCKN